MDGKFFCEYFDDFFLLFGDLVLGFEIVVKEVVAEGKVIMDYLSYIVVYGMLHFFGYDYYMKVGVADMERLEVGILVSLGVVDFYGNGVLFSRGK